MSLSLAVTAGAAFTDQDDVNYGVAVDTMVELGVINGYTDGSFKPANAVTRAEAAKMIAYTVAGADEATINYYAGATKFEDVVGSYAWASAAVNYCAGKDIIAGRSETVFDPGATVTGAELAKMILVALGYEPDTANKAEALVGANWQTNAISMALKLGLFDGLNNDFVATQAANREETAQIIFNALDVVLKEVAFVIDDYYVYKDVVNADKEPVTLLADGFGADADPVSDEFGRPATKYSNFDNDDIEDITIAEYADFVFTGKMTEKEVFNAIGASGEKAGSYKTIKMTTITEDGVKWDGVYGPSETLTVRNDIKENTPGFGNGITVEVFETANDNEFVMVAIREYAGEVTKVEKADETAGTARTITIALDQSPWGYGKTVTFETEEFDLDDKVLCTLTVDIVEDEVTVQTVKAPEVISGKVAKITNNEVYTIGGVNYELSQLHNVSLSLNDEGSWYVDSMGNIIAKKEATTTDWNYGILVDYETSAYNEGTLLGDNVKDNAEKFKIINAEGDEVILDGAFTVDSDNVATFVGKDLAKKMNVLVRYELDGDKIETIENVDARTNGFVDDTGATVSKGAALLEGKYVTDETLFFVFESADDYAVYEGYKNIPTSTVANTYRAFYAVNDDGTADATTFAAVILYVDDAAAQTDANYVYFATADKTVEDTDDGKITTYTNVYLDGEKGTLVFKGNGPDFIAEGDLYAFTTDTKTGYATLKTWDGKVTAASAADRSGRLSAYNTVTNITSGYIALTKGDTSLIEYIDADTVFYQVDFETGAVTVVEGMPATSDNYTIGHLFSDCGGSYDDASTVVYFTVEY